MSLVKIFIVLQFVILLYLLYFRSHLTNKQISLYSSIVFYLSIIAIVVITKFALRSELDSFDTNNDGVFNGEEIRPEQRNALKKVSSDTSLIFAPFVGIIFSIMYFIVLLVGLKMFRKKSL